MRDLEAQLVVLTDNKELQAKIEQVSSIVVITIQKEREIVFSESKEVKKETWTKERNVPWWIPHARNVFSTFM